MPRGRESARGRLLSGAGLGILSYVVSPALVDEAVGDGLAREVRLRSLPSRLGVFFVLGLCLFSADAGTRVMGRLVAGMEKALEAAGWVVPAATSLTGLRRRLGEMVLQSVFRRLAGAFSPGKAAWSHLGGLLVAAVDGTGVAVPDTPGNAAYFGRAGSGRRGKGKEAAEPGAARASVYPQARVVTMIACGTRAVIGAAFGPVRGKGSGERELAMQLLGSVHPGMLLLADRGFYSWKLWSAAAGRGADLLWRVTCTGNGALRLPVLLELPDGSWVSRVWEKSARPDRKDRGASLPVRVIEFTITVEDQGEQGEDVAGEGGKKKIRTERYRLVTTLMDHRAFPAAMLAACYARRWSAELSNRELKTVLRGSGRVLRARSPELARQEIWAYLAVYQALRIIIARAAARDGRDPARISFTAARDAAQDSITTARTSMPAALDTAEATILSPRALVPLRQGRVRPRQAKRRAATFQPARRTQHIPRRVACTVTITPPGTATPQPHHQPKQPRQPQPDPP